MRSTTAHGQQAPAAVARNRQQPRRQVARSIPVRQAPQCPNKALLRHVFGVLPVAQHAVTKTKYLAVELFHKPQHGGLLARQTTVNQFVKVVAQRSSPPSTAARFNKLYPELSGPVS